MITKTKKNIRQSGGILFGKKNAVKDNSTPLTYRNLIYPSGHVIIPELRCLVCGRNQFKLRTMENVGKRNVKNFLIEGFIGETFTERNFKLFACASCGFQMHFSNKMEIASQSKRAKSLPKTKSKSKSTKRTMH